jgi:hypothetical protein
MPVLTRTSACDNYISRTSGPKSSSLKGTG